MSTSTKFIKSLTYNYFLGAFIFICCALLMLIAKSIAVDLEVATTNVVVVIVSCGVLVFGFFGHFYTVMGAVFKALTFFVLGAIIFYVTSSLEDKNIINIVRLSIGLFVLFGLYGAVKAVRTAATENDLIKNGYQLDAVFKEVKCVNTGEIYLYSIIATAKHPETDEILLFKSDETYENLESKVHEGDQFKVYLSKQDKAKYIFQMPE